MEDEEHDSEEWTEEYEMNEEEVEDIEEDE